MGLPGSPQYQDAGSRLSRTPAPAPLKPARRPVGPSLCGNNKGGVNAGEIGLRKKSFWTGETTVDEERF